MGTKSSGPLLDLTQPEPDFSKCLHLVNRGQTSEKGLCPAQTTALLPQTHSLSEQSLSLFQVEGLRVSAWPETPEPSPQHRGNAGCADAQAQHTTKCSYNTSQTSITNISTPRWPWVTRGHSSKGERKELFVPLLAHCGKSSASELSNSVPVSTEGQAL